MGFWTWIVAVQYREAEGYRPIPRAPAAQLSQPGKSRHAQNAGGQVHFYFKNQYLISNILRARRQPARRAP